MFNYLLMINIFTFIVYIIDKYSAVHHNWRVSENKLLFLAAIGGGFAAMMAMILLQHKIRKIKFCICIPSFLLLHYVIIITIT